MPRLPLRRCLRPGPAPGAVQPRSCRSLLGRRPVRVRTMRHMRNDADRIHEEIDGHVGEQRDQHVEAGQRRRYRVGRAQQAVDRPGLASDFGHDPAGDDGDEADGRRELAQLQKQRRIVEPAAPAQPSAEQHDAKHQHAASDHDAKSKEWNRDGRPLIGRKILETLDLAVELVGQDQAPEQRHVDGRMIRSRLSRRGSRTA